MIVICGQPLDMMLQCVQAGPKAELIAGDMDETEIEKYLEVDVLLYQNVKDLVEAVTRKGNHYIDRPCMACLDGKYVADDINHAKTVEMEIMRNDNRNRNQPPGV